jgi:hypothetical protein
VKNATYGRLDAELSPAPRRDIANGGTAPRTQGGNFASAEWERRFGITTRPISGNAPRGDHGIVASTRRLAACRRLRRRALAERLAESGDGGSGSQRSAGSRIGSSPVGLRAWLGNSIDRESDRRRSRCRSLSSGPEGASDQSRSSPSRSTSRAYCSAALLARLASTAGSAGRRGQRRRLRWPRFRGFGLLVAGVRRRGRARFDRRRMAAK